jgi:hypothetical protein
LPGTKEIAEGSSPFAEGSIRTIESVTVLDLAHRCAASLRVRDFLSGRPGRERMPPSATVDRMRRSRLRPAQVPGAYRWYDRDTGAIDLIALALDSMTGVRSRPKLEEPPEWIRGLGVPERLPHASLPELARLSGAACRAWVDAGRPGLEV